MKKKNLILITIDSLRADRLGIFGYDKKITPNIDNLSKESIFFENAFSVGSSTPYSFPAILTSTYPLDYHGPGKIERPRILISEILEREGYITCAVHSNPYLSEFFGYDKGWDYFECILLPKDELEMKGVRGIEKDFFDKLKKILNEFQEISFKSLAKISALTFPEILFFLLYLKHKIEGRAGSSIKVKAEEINKIAKEFLSSTKGHPFFLWIHYMDAHGPYFSKRTYLKDLPPSFSETIGRYLNKFSKVGNLPKKAREFIKKNLKKSIDLYDEMIEYIDSQIGDILNFLKEKNFYQNSIICLASDHGEEFLEHGGTFHSNKLYNELLRVPLLIKIPEGKNLIFKKKFSLIDLPSTLLHLLDIEIPNSFKGKDLFSQEREFIFHQTISDVVKEQITYMKEKFPFKMALQNQNWKYIRDFGTMEEELFNLEKDPNEKENLAKKEKSILLKFREKMEEFKRENPPFSLLK